MANLVLDMELYKVAGAEVNMVVGMVVDMVATKVFLNQTFFRQKKFCLPHLAHLLCFASLFVLFLVVYFVFDCLDKVCRQPNR